MNSQASGSMNDMDEFVPMYHPGTFVHGGIMAVVSLISIPMAISLIQQKKINYHRNLQLFNVCLMIISIVYLKIAHATISEEDHHAAQYTDTKVHHEFIGWCLLVFLTYQIISSVYKSRLSGRFADFYRQTHSSFGWLFVILMTAQTAMGLLLNNPNHNPNYNHYNPNNPRIYAFWYWWCLGWGCYE